jgi:hypothetical protein
VDGSRLTFELGEEGEDGGDFLTTCKTQNDLALPLMKSKLYVEGARVVGIGHRCGVPAG